MKLDKAIENLKDALADKWCPWSQELKDSIKLGIEALKLIQRERLLSINPVETILPGETEK